MLFFIGFLGAMFILMFLSTIHTIVHKPTRYLPPTIVTALLGACWVCLIIIGLKN